MAVSLAPSPPPIGTSPSRSQAFQPATSSSSATPWLQTPVPQRPVPTVGASGMRYPSPPSATSAPLPSQYPLGQASPTLSYSGPPSPLFANGSPTVMTAPPPFSGYQAPAGAGVRLSPPLSHPPVASSAMTYASMPAYSAPFHSGGPFYVPPPQVSAGPLTTTYGVAQHYQRQQSPQSIYNGYAQLPLASTAANAALATPPLSPMGSPELSQQGGYHPYRRPPNAVRPGPLQQPRVPEQSMFSQPIRPEDLARMRRQSSGSSSPRDPQPFPGRIRTQSSDSVTSIQRPHYSHSDRSETPTSPGSEQANPIIRPSNSSSSAVTVIPAHRTTPSTASAGAAIAGPPPLPSTEKKRPANKLVGGLRRAFSMQSLSNNSVPTPRTPDLSRDSTSSSGTSGASSSPPPTPPIHLHPTSASARRLGMSRNNKSSDNLSISSTVSSASMMIRKLGQIGKRSSLSGISAMFGKTNERNEVDTVRAGSELGVAPPSQKFRRKDRKKADVVDPSVSQVTAELDRLSSSATTSGLTPAEALVRKHHHQVAQQEAAAQARAHSQREEPPARRWGFGSRSASPVPTSVPILPALQPPIPVDLTFVSGPNAAFHGSPTEDIATPTDETPRASLEELVYQQPASQFDDDTASFYDAASEYEGSIFAARATVPAHSEPPSAPPKGILKNARSYNQEDLIKPHSAPFAPAHLALRGRTGSYDVPSSESLPSHHADILAPADVVDGVATSLHSPVYSHPSYNVSAPILRRDPSALHLAQRAASSPQVRRCSFAPNLNVQPTWPAAVYDRRAEPATCNRLTPALAQSIKEELNDYKMTEMNVHAHSRIYTHFFV